MNLFMRERRRKIWEWKLIKILKLAYYKREKLSLSEHWRSYRSWWWPTILICFLSESAFSAANEFLDASWDDSNSIHGRSWKTRKSKSKVKYFVKNKQLRNYWSDECIANKYFPRVVTFLYQNVYE
jgi:hypothetical protein